jgi:hypothetical protein
MCVHLFIGMIRERSLYGDSGFLLWESFGAGLVLLLVFRHFRRVVEKKVAADSVTGWSFILIGVLSIWRSDLVWMTFPLMLLVILVEEIKEIREI